MGQILQLPETREFSKILAEIHVLYTNSQTRELRKAVKYANDYVETLDNITSLAEIHSMIKHYPYFTGKPGLERRALKVLKREGEIFDREYGLFA